MSQQLVKKGTNGKHENVMPRSWIEAIKDKNTGQTLVEILQGFNMYFLPYNGNTSSTRCLVPTILRKKGLWITYVKYDGNVYTEWYAADEIDDKSWGDSSNWRIGNNTLVGDITISANGNWVINGTETEFKAVGEKGNTPLLRVANNRLQVSYDLGDTYIDVTNNPVYTKFRWLATTGDTQANNVGRIQASTDEGKTWTNMSNDFTNNLHIKKYIGVNESLPTSGIAEGTIYAKGPYYAEDDTLNDNPIYRLWVYAWKDNTLAWQDNGEFTGIAAGVVQETGDSETEVMSQKAVTEKLSELGSKVNGLDLRLTSSFGFTKDQYVWDFPTNVTRLAGFYRPNGEFVESQNHLTGVIDVVYGQLVEVSYNIANYSKNISLLSYWKDEELLETPLSTDTHGTYTDSFIISIPQGVNKISVFGNIKVITENKTELSLRRLDLLNDFTTFTSDNILLEKNYTWVLPSSNTVESLRGYYRPNGEFVSSSHITNLIKVSPLQLLKLNINYSNYSNAALITLWNNETFMGSPLTSDLYPEYKGTVIVTIPKNVNKIGIISNDAITAFVPAIKAEESNNTDILVNSLQVQSGNLILTSEVHKELGIDNLGKIQFPPQGGWNLCVVKVKPNTTYYIRANDYRENAVGALGYSDTKDITPDKTISEVDMDSLPSYNGYKVFTTDDTTEYLYINLTPLLKDNNVVIKENIEDLELPTTIGEREILKQLESIDSGVSSFKDKKIALFGDSITHQAIGSYPNRGWATYFNQILQFGELVNYARSGATWSNTASTIYNITENTGSLSNDNVIYNQFNRLLNDISNGAKAPDYIIIAAGTNDAWYPHHRPNALSKTAKEVFEDESTDYLESVNINQCTSIAQAFRYVAEMIIANLPTTKVVICTPLQSTAFTAERNNSVTEVISSCANYMSWNVIVQSKECGLSRLEEKRGYKNTYDGTHTSETGAKAIGTYLANKFSSMFRETL